MDLAPPSKTSGRLGRIAASATSVIGRKMLDLKRRGVHVANLAIGEPDGDTPVHIRDAAKRAVDSGATRYTEVQGRHDLRVAVTRWLESFHGFAFDVDQVMVSTGSKQVLYNLFQALLDDGDEVIIPVPCWTSYGDIVTVAGGRPVFVPCDPANGFVPDPGRVAAAITDRTRALLVPTPNNPTGAVFPEPILRAMVDLCARYRLVAVTDDIYRSFFYGAAPPVSVARLAREAGVPFAIVDGVSKAYCMTGWRIGFGAGHPALIRTMGVLQSQSTTCACSVSQAAALEAISGPQTCVEQLRADFAERRQLMIARLRSLPRVELAVEPAGAFYALPSVAGWRGARTAAGRVLDDDVALAEFLLDEVNVAVAAGAWFAAPGFLRLSFAARPEEIDDAMGRVARALETLTPAD